MRTAQEQQERKASLSHKKNLRIHAKKRLYQRYGLKVNKQGYRRIKSRIGSDEGWFLKNMSKRLALYLIHYRGTYLFTVYDKNQLEIATFLTMDMSEIKKIYARCGMPLENYGAWDRV